jgi:hypothetical protein
VLSLPISASCYVIPLCCLSFVISLRFPTLLPVDAVRHYSGSICTCTCPSCLSSIAYFLDFCLPFFLFLPTFMASVISFRLIHPFSQSFFKTFSIHCHFFLVRLFIQAFFFSVSFVFLFFFSNSFFHIHSTSSIFYSYLLLFFSLKERGYLENLGVGGRTLNCILWREMGGRGLPLSGSGWGKVAVCCNRLMKLRSIKWWEILD